jgi:hypothetical protein
MPSASRTACTTAGIAPIVPSSPTPLTPRRFVLHHRQVGRARHAVVHERAGEELAALGVIHRLFAQRLSGALRHAAVDLSFDDHVIDDAADVVAARDAHDMHFTGLAIDLDFAGLRPVRP